MHFFSFNKTNTIILCCSYSVTGKSDRGYRGATSSSEFTFDTCLASLHTYLGGRHMLFYGIFLILCGTQNYQRFNNLTC